MSNQTSKSAAFARGIACTTRSERIAYRDSPGKLLSANDPPLGVPACEDPRDERRCLQCPMREAAQKAPKA